MAPFVLFSTIFSPALLCIGIILVAMMQGGIVEGSTVPPLESLIKCCVAVSAAPLIAASLVESLYRWCFESKPPRTIGILAALETLIYLLDDPAYLSSLKSSFVSPGGTLAQIAPLMIQALTTALFAAALIVLGVLFIEIPIRWGMGTFGKPERVGVLKALRAIMLYLLIGAGWPVVRTTGGDILGLLHQSNTSTPRQSHFSSNDTVNPNSGSNAGGGYGR